MNSQKPAADAAAALMLAHEILHEIGMPATGDIVDRVALRIETALEQLVGRERERWVAICKRRAYLADAIRSG